jgi:hypothetical protein
VNVAKTTKPKAGATNIDASATDAAKLSENTVDDKSKIMTTDFAINEPVSTDPPQQKSNNSEDVASLDLGIVPDEALDVESVEGDFSDLADELVVDLTKQKDLDTAIQIKTRDERKSKSGSISLLMGGVVICAIGYGAATYYPLNYGLDNLNVQLAEQADQIAALEMQIENIPRPNLSSFTSQITDFSEQIAMQFGDLSENLNMQVTDIEVRLVEVEKAPGVNGTLSDSTFARYDSELNQFRIEMTAQREELVSVIALAETNLAAVRAEAAELEKDSIATAQAASVRAALNRLATAVETGAPFGDALSDIGALDLPLALMDVAENGVATTAQLTEAFPTAARSALSTARAEGVSDDAVGLGGFLRSQFELRSTSPQDGAGPDAILSRAEAAIKEGRVADALAELKALPEVSRAEMTDWTARATQRANALDALVTLSETYN